MKAIALLLLVPCLLAGCSQSARYAPVALTPYRAQAGCGPEAGPFRADCSGPRLGIADFLPPRVPEGA